MKNLLTILFLVFSIIIASCSSKKENEGSTSQEPAKAAESKTEHVAVIQKQTEGDTLKGSLKAEAMGTIGSADVKISYHSPAVRGRIIWGGLVAFDKVWVTGAHMATSIEFTSDVTIEGKQLPAGKYAFFTIPGKDSWVVIFNKNWQQHLADEYDAKDDVLRLTVTPAVQVDNQERLMYAIEDSSLTMSWEKLKISIPLESSK